MLLLSCNLWMKQINIDWLNSGSCVIVPSNSRWQMDVHKAIGHLMCFQKKKNPFKFIAMYARSFRKKNRSKKENLTQHSYWCSLHLTIFQFCITRKCGSGFFCWEWNLDLTMHFRSSLRINSHGRPSMNSLCKTILSSVLVF